MSPTLFGPIPTTDVTITVAIEPVHNVLASLARVTAADLDPTQEPWAAAVAGRLTSAQRDRNRLIFDGLGAALLPTKAYRHFPPYVDGLAAVTPAALRDRLLARMSERVPHEEPIARLDDVDAWVDYVARCYPNMPMDRALQQEVHALLNDPDVLQQMIVTHLRELWRDVLAEPWAKQLSMMEYVTTELNARPWPTASPDDLIRAFLRREPPREIRSQLAGVQHVIFVPSPYLHLHAARFGDPTTIWVFVQADFWALPMRTEPIKRGEVLRTLRALADDVRLHLLELLVAHDEVRAQDLIAQVDVGQSTVSRHLKQLRAVELITEQRGTDANKSYRFNPQTVNDLVYKLQQLLTAENARQVVLDPRLDAPPALQRFLDRDMRVTTWPAKRDDQQGVLAYLAGKFTVGEEYIEREVTELLDEWHTYGNPAYLRRSLIDEGYLNRTKDGACYWRPDGSD